MVPQRFAICAPAGARAVLSFMATLLVVTACSDQTGPVRLSIAIAAGDGQRALAGTELPELIVVALHDASQRPLAGVNVTWSIAPGAADVVVPVSAVTDGNGTASARWQLDASPGTHMLVVAADGGVAARANAFADPAPPSSITPLSLITYEGSGQAVHPDFVRLPATWSGDPYRLVATPYPGGNAAYENPSLFAGSTGTHWFVPSGVHNPLELPSAGNYLSDPDMVFDPDAAELRIYYRRVTSQNEIWMIRSADGVRWSVPVLSVAAANHMIVSPSIVRRSSAEWLMWSVNAGTTGCGATSTTVELRRSTDGVRWSNPEVVALADPDGWPWHLDVAWIPSRNEYWAIYPVKQPGGCTTDRIRLATSADGVHWTSHPSPLLARGAAAVLKDIVYRSTFDVDAASGIVTVWYSGASYDHGGYSWHLAWERLSLDALFARVDAPVNVAARSEAASPRALPALTNETAP